MLNLQYERIAIEGGAPLLRDCGLPVEEVINMLAVGMSFDEIMDACAPVSRDDILACLEYAYAK